jgi:hypothetical protein
MISLRASSKPPPLDDQEVVCAMRFAAARALSLVIPILDLFQCSIFELFTGMFSE